MIWSPVYKPFVPTGLILQLALNFSGPIIRRDTLLLPVAQVAVLTTPLHSDVSNRGGIRGSSCENIPR